MITLYRCPSVKSNRVVSREASEDESRLLLYGAPENTKMVFVDSFYWYTPQSTAIEANRIKRNKLIARKAREIQKLSEVY